jgi:hypothetical protein
VDHYVTWKDVDFLRKYCLSIHAFGLGFIQIKLSFGPRLHLYTEQVRQTQEPEDVHDHRYGFLSTVIQGRLINELWAVVPDPNGEFELTQVTCKPGEAGEPEFLSTCRLQRIAKHAVLPGPTYEGCYEMDRDSFHRVTADEGTITLLTRDKPSKEFARVARRKGSPAVCPFSANVFSEDELWEIYERSVSRGESYANL